MEYRAEVPARPYNGVPVDLDDLSDEELVLLGQQGGSEAVLLLFGRYRLLINSLSKKYYLLGADREDLVQEAMLGFYKAIRDYNRAKNMSFKNFAVLCVKRQIITAIKTAARQKHQPLNSFASLEREFNEQAGNNLLHTIKNGDSMDPERQVILNETLSQVKSTLQVNLSKLELHSLILYLRGYTYRQMAEEIGVSDKTITNSMYRVQKKLRKLSACFVDI